jgi:Ca2+-binding RTX toxin-like protein
VLGTGANNHGVTLSFNGNALGTIVPTQGSQFALVIALVTGGYDTVDASALSVSSVLVGGAGNDTLYGGSGRNLLIGGAGADTLHAGSAGDILIGGSTSYDSNTTALAYIMAEWNRTDVSYSTRVKQLNGSQSGGLNGSYFLKSSTVSDDNTTDLLYGGASLDWFLPHKTGKHQDQMIGQTSGEVVTKV